MRSAIVQRLGNGIVQIDCSRADNHEMLLQAVRESALLVDSVAELWLLGERFDLTRENVLTLATAARAKEHSPLRTAIVTSGDMQYGLMRAYAVYREDGHASVRVFRSAEPALEWLRDDPDGRTDPVS